MMRKPLNQNLRIRLNEDEEKGLLELALALREKTRCRVVRKLIREAIGQGPDFLKDNLDAFREDTRQIGALARNVNQIARAIHTGQVRNVTWDSKLLDQIYQLLTTHYKTLLAIVQHCQNRGARLRLPVSQGATILYREDQRDGQTAA